MLELKIVFALSIVLFCSVVLGYIVVRKSVKKIRKIIKVEKQSQENGGRS